MSSYSNEYLVDSFLDHIRYLHIGHHVPGRIRVKANWSAVKQLSKVDTSQLERVVETIPGIINYRANKKALSVIIEYDTRILPYALWENAGKLSEYPIHRETVRGQLLGVLQQHRNEP